MFIMENDVGSVSMSTVKTNEDEKRKSKFRDGIRLVFISSAVAAGAGVITSVIAKKRARQYLSIQGCDHELPESGTSLALKALCYATIITLGSFSLAIFGVCKWLDINNMEDLRKRIRKVRPSNPTEKTEFENLSDFLSYLNERYSKTEEAKA